MTSKLRWGIVAGGLLAAAAYATETITYKYDARGRLIEVDRNQVVNNTAANVVSNYSYDKADNRSNKTTTGSPNPPPP
jgi:YD repeat-containing protein